MVVAFQQACACIPPHRMTVSMGDEQWLCGAPVTFCHQMIRSVAARIRRADAVLFVVDV
jgi:hypothetical protein